MMGMDRGRGTGMGGSSEPIPVSDFRHQNLGLPKNIGYPLEQQPVNRGLGGELGMAAENGKFKTPHLRNIALTPPYMHNGVLKALMEVVHIYNTRDILGPWNSSVGWEFKSLRRHHFMAAPKGCQFNKIFSQAPALVGLAIGESLAQSA